MTTKKTNVEKVANMLSTGKRCKVESICKRLFGVVTEGNKSNVRAIISRLNSDGAGIERVDTGVYQQL